MTEPSRTAAPNEVCDLASVLCHALQGTQTYDNYMQDVGSDRRPAGFFGAAKEPDEQERIAAAVEVLEEHGPALGRPLVDTISRSRHPNMKELIPPAENIRILFAFDSRRSAILLIGGDKSG